MEKAIKQITHQDTGTMKIHPYMSVALRTALYTTLVLLGLLAVASILFANGVLVP